MRRDRAGRASWASQSSRQQQVAFVVRNLGDLDRSFDVRRKQRLEQIAGAQALQREAVGATKVVEPSDRVGILAPPGIELDEDGEPFPELEEGSKTLHGPRLRAFDVELDHQ